MDNMPELDDDEFVFDMKVIVKNPNGYEAAKAEFEEKLREWGFDDEVHDYDGPADPEGTQADPPEAMGGTFWR